MSFNYVIIRSLKKILTFFVGLCQHTKLEHRLSAFFINFFCFVGALFQVIFICLGIGLFVTQRKNGRFPPLILYLSSLPRPLILLLLVLSLSLKIPGCEMRNGGSFIRKIFSRLLPRRERLPIHPRLVFFLKLLRGDYFRVVHRAKLYFGQF